MDFNPNSIRSLLNIDIDSGKIMAIFYQFLFPLSYRFSRIQPNLEHVHQLRSRAHLETTYTAIIELVYAKRPIWIELESSIRWKDSPLHMKVVGSERK